MAKENKIRNLALRSFFTGFMFSMAVICMALLMVLSDWSISDVLVISVCWGGLVLAVYSHWKKVLRAEFEIMCTGSHKNAELWAVKLYSRLHLLRQAYKSGDSEIIQNEDVRASSILAEFTSNFYNDGPTS